MNKKNKQNRMPGFHIYKSHDKQFYWSFISRNGRTIGKSSETYKTKQAVVKSINTMLDMFQAQDYCLYYDHTKQRTRHDAVDLYVIK